MINEDKIRLADVVLSFIRDKSEDKASSPQMVGHLNKPAGINGFKRAEVGTPVFDNGKRYFISLESIDGKRVLEVEYYKESFRESIDFFE